MLTAAIPVKVDLSTKTIKITYFYPKESDELLLVIHDGKADMLIFRDCLSAYFPKANFDLFDEATLQSLCTKLYRQITKNWLKEAAKGEIAKAQLTC